MSDFPAGQGPGKGAADGDALVAAFRRWSAEARAGDAAVRRSRERWLRQQATETATLAGVLTDLAERQADVAVTTRSRRVVGRLVGVAQDFTVVEERSGAAVLVATPHVVGVAPVAEPGRAWAARGDPSGDRHPPLALRLVDALGVLAADRSPVRLGVVGGEVLLGKLWAVGIDVVTLRGDPRALGNGPSRREDLYVPLDAIEACTPR
jgi:hypothetical protein